MNVRRYTAGLVMLAIGAAAWGAPGEADLDALTEFREVPGVRELSGRLLVKPVEVEDWLEQGLARAAAETRSRRARERLRAWLVEHRPVLGDYLLKVPADSTERQLARVLLETGDYEYVEPDWLVAPTECPNDELFDSQWHHRTMQSCDGWDVHTGSDVIVAICDTGVRATHEDLAATRVPGYNAVDRIREQDGGRVDDINGHGTQTTGCAAAMGDNLTGVSGMGWNLRHMMIRVTNRDDGLAFTSDLTHGALWAVQNGAKVASVSYGGATTFSADNAGEVIRETYGGLLVWSAGNESRDLGSADPENVIVVGASTQTDDLANFSNYGEAIDCVAPGVNVVTTTRNSDFSYGAVPGTSFSAPLVAGLIGLVWSFDSTLTPDEVEAAVLEGCDDLGTPGEDDRFGHGRINVFNTLLLADRLKLFVDPLPLNGGEGVELLVTNGEPGAMTGVFYSLRGEGETFVPALGVNLGLENAKAAAPLEPADANGEARWRRRVPDVPRAMIVWLQAAQDTGNVSGIILTQINR